MIPAFPFLLARYSEPFYISLGNTKRSSLQARSAERFTAKTVDVDLCSSWLGPRSSLCSQPAPYGDRHFREAVTKQHTWGYDAVVHMSFPVLRDISRPVESARYFCTVWVLEY